ncbi:hypothetical protein GE061_018109, partial [Apolygus lucorum]
DDLTQQIADYLRENAWLWKLVSIFLCIALTLTQEEQISESRTNGCLFYC